MPKLEYYKVSNDWEFQMQNGNGSAVALQVTAREIREELKIPYSKINYYTDLGLFPIIRKSGNKRIYDRNEVESRYRVISRLANEGYPLGLIRKKILGLVSNELL